MNEAKKLACDSFDSLFPRLEIAFFSLSSDQKRTGSSQKFNNRRKESDGAPVRLSLVVGMAQSAEQCAR